MPLELLARSQREHGHWLAKMRSRSPESTQASDAVTLSFELFEGPLIDTFIQQGITRELLMVY